MCLFPEAIAIYMETTRLLELCDFPRVNLILIVIFKNARGSRKPWIIAARPNEKPYLDLGILTFYDSGNNHAAITGV